MEFTNSIVGGSDELVRDAIQSRGFISGVTGWRIESDGDSEFNDVTVRGELIIGTPPSPPNAYIHGTVLGGVPTIAVYDGTHTDPARIQGFDLGGEGGMVLDSGDPAAEDTSLALAGDFGELFYEDTPNAVSGLVHVGMPYTTMVQLRAQGNGARDLEIALDLASATPDNVGGRIRVRGEFLHNIDAADSNYCTRVVDGKMPGATTETTIGSGVGGDTNILTANIQNVYVEEGYAYRVTVHIDHKMSQLGTRLDYKLWDGAVGSSNQLGGTNRRWADQATATLYAGTVLIFVWRAAATETISSMNLSAIKAVNAAAVADVAVNQGFSAIVEKIGDANMIGGL